MSMFDDIDRERYDKEVEKLLGELATALENHTVAAVFLSLAAMCAHACIENEDVPLPHFIKLLQDMHDAYARKHDVYARRQPS